MQDALSVIHFSWSDQIGGITRLMKDLVECQHAMGLCRPQVLLGRRDMAEALMTGSDSIPVQDLGLRSGFDLSPRRICVALTFFRGGDVIHLHSFHPAVAFAAARSGRPIVYTEHGTFGGAESSKAWSSIKRRLFSYFLNKYVGVVTFNSDFTRQKMLDYYGLRGTKSAVVYNGTNLKTGSSGETRASEEVRQRLAGRFVVGTFARLVARKRIDRAIRALREVSNPESVALLVVGDGPEAQQLKMLARELGLSSSVIFAGAHPDVSPFLACMDLCVFPAEREPFGLVAVEAYSAGKRAMVFADGGGLVEIVKLFAPDDIIRSERELAHRIERYRANPEILIDGRACQAHAETFNIERTARAFNDLYIEIAHGHTTVSVAG